MSEVCAPLHEFADGELPEWKAMYFERHLADCLSCQHELQELLVLRTMMHERGARLPRPGPSPVPHSNIDEQTGAAFPATMEIDPGNLAAAAGPVPRAGLARPRWWRGWPVAAALASAAAVMLVLFFDPRPAPPAGGAALGVGVAPVGGPLAALSRGGRRPMAERLSHPQAARYYPAPEVMRGQGLLAASAGQLDPQALLRLQQDSDAHGMAVLWLAAGESQQAQALLADLPDSHQVANDRAVVALHQGDLPAAERWLAWALRMQPDYLPARWNRALLSLRLGDETTARADLRFVIKAGEPGWSEEARDRLRGLGGVEPVAGPAVGSGSD